MTKNQLRRIWYQFFSDHPDSYFGRFLLKILPLSFISQCYYEIFPGRESKGFFADIIKREICRQYYLQSDEAIRRTNKEKFWGSGPGKDWHNFIKLLYTDREKFNKEFLSHRTHLISHISKLLSISNNYSVICDIGTGNGMLLNYLSKKFTSVKKFVGIDLNKEQILENRITYKDIHLEFVHAEITNWIHTNGEKGTIFVSCGTFLYFTQNELQELFKAIGQLSPSAVVLNEPVNLDLKTEIVSRPRGGLAFSHNYPYLLKQCGYHIVNQHIQPPDLNCCATV